MEKGYRIRHKNWPELYFLTLKDNEVYDSSGNLYIQDFKQYIKLQAETSDAAGHMWEIYYEVTDENL